MDLLTAIFFSLNHHRCQFFAQHSNTNHSEKTRSIIIDQSPVTLYDLFRINNIPERDRASLCNDTPDFRGVNFNQPSNSRQENTGRTSQNKNRIHAHYFAFSSFTLNDFNNVKYCSIAHDICYARLRHSKRLVIYQQAW